MGVSEKPSGLRGASGDGAACRVASQEGSWGGERTLGETVAIWVKDGHLVATVMTCPPHSPERCTHSYCAMLAVGGAGLGTHYVLPETFLRFFCFLPLFSVSALDVCSVIAIRFL